MPDDPTKTVSSKVMYQNRWMTVHEDKTTTPSGAEGLYGYIESKDSVMVAVIDQTNRIYMVKAFRYPTKSWGWELPGGSSDGEDLLSASKRELREETGIMADTWEMLGKTLVCNGLMTEYTSTCVATNLDLNGEKEDADEIFQGMQFFSIDEIDAMIDTGDINDGQTITGLYLAKRWLTQRETK